MKNIIVLVERKSSLQKRDFFNQDIFHFDFLNQVSPCLQQSWTGHGGKAGFKRYLSLMSFCRSGLQNIHIVEETFVHYILLELQGAKIIEIISYPPAWFYDVASDQLG